MIAHASSLVVYVSFQSIASGFLVFSFLLLFFVSHCLCLYVFVIIFFLVSVTLLVPLQMVYYVGG